MILPRPNSHCRCFATLLLASLFSFRFAHPDDALVPALDSAWWQVAGNPDLGSYTRTEQEPVDFSIWQAADGTWQLWSCIRKTGCGGQTRLFYRWQGQNLSDSNWKPMGIAMEARTDLGETAGGLQAPHVIKHDGIYTMAYGDWVNICFATSKDGKTFDRIVRSDGETGAFSEGPESNTRDPMLLRVDGVWHCYYTARVHDRGYIFCRTSPNLKTWSLPIVVSYGGGIGPSPWEIECPFVVQPQPGVFYLFRNQYYGPKARNWVYRSTNPFNFGIDDDKMRLRNWHLAAPEVLRHHGQYYVAALLDSLDGIHIARMNWVPLAQLGDEAIEADTTMKKKR